MRVKPIAVPRGNLLMAIRILGKQCAAARALDDLDRRLEAGEQARVWIVGDHYVVGPIPQDPHS